MGQVRSARGHWVRRDLIAWNGPAGPGISHRLNSIPLSHDSRGLPEAVRAKFPHLRNFNALILPADALPEVAGILRDEIVVSAWREGSMLDATSVQIAGVLDDLF